MFAPPKIFSMPTPVQLIGHLKILALQKNMNVVEYSTST